MEGKLPFGFSFFSKLLQRTPHVILGLIFQNKVGPPKQGRPNDEPFAVSMMGENLVIVTNGQDAASIYSDTTSLSWAKFLKRIAGIFGIDRSQ